MTFFPVYRNTVNNINGFIYYIKYFIILISILQSNNVVTFISLPRNQNQLK